MQYRLQDLIDINHFQELQDRLNEIYCFPSAIIDNDGQVLTATAWQDICTTFHRKHAEAERLCIASDQYIKEHLHEANPAVTYRCPHGLVDNATPIIIDGVHYGNFFTGQFFLEEPDLEFFRGQAKKYGFNEEAYLAAVKKVPIWSEEQLNSYLFFIKGLIAVISESGLKKLKEIEHRLQIEKSEQYYRSIIKAAMDGYWLADTEGRLLEVNDAYCRMSGYSEEELLEMRIADLEVNESPEMVAEHMQRLIAKGADRFVSRHRRKDGTVFDVEVSTQCRTGENGQYVCFLRDITEQKQLESQLLNAIDLAHLAPWEYDFKADLFTFNDQFYKLLRTTAAEIGGYQMSSAEYAQRVIHPEDRGLVKDEIRASIETSDPHFNRQIDHRIVYGDGQVGYISVRYTIVKDAQGVTVRSYGVNQDISERRQTYERVRQAHEKMALAADSACFGIWDYHLEDNRLEWDDWMFRLYGVDRANFAGVYAAWQMGLHPDDRERMNREVALALRGEKDFDSQFRIVRPDGQVRHIRAHGSVSRDGSGKPVHMIGVNYDITEHVTAIKELKESEERFKALHNASFGGIAIHDKGIILECNKGLSEISGYDYDELIGMNGLLLISDDTRAEVVKNIAAGYEKPYEVRGRRKNGEIYPLRLEARNIPFKGTPVRVVEFRDISENKRAEAEREELEAKLHQAQKMEFVGRLAGGVAHDFNNMLGVIIGHAELAQDTLDPSSPAAGDIAEIRRAAERSANLTRQLLAFARKQTIAPRVLNLNDAIESMLKMVRRLIGEDIDLAWLPGSDLWAIKVDPSQLDQILANLCVNARDAISDVGKITIETANVSFDSAYCAAHPGFLPGRYVALSLSDNGHGMERETLAHLFEPFFTTKERNKGTGLGLATVYGIVKQNNGFINVYSEPGVGTTFKLYLPSCAPAMEGSEETQAPPAVMGGSETILVVEDEPTIMNMTRTILERLGYTVLTAATPGQALRLAETYQGRIDVLLTDVIMPEMNGRELARKLMAVNAHIRPLFMSGYTANIIAHHGVLDEGVQFIEKPFSKSDLSRKIREVLGRSRH